MGDTASGQPDEHIVRIARQLGTNAPDAASVAAAHSPTPSAAHSPTRSPAPTHAPVEPALGRDAFPVAAAVDVFSACDGGASLAVSPPRWLCATGGGLTAGALAVLAEVALTTAVLTTVGDGEEVVAASLHLEVEGYPLEDGRVRPGRLGGPFETRAPAKAPTVLPPAGKVSMAATVKDGDDAPLRHVTGIATDAAGTVLATASALCVLVPAPTLPARPGTTADNQGSHGREANSPDQPDQPDPRTKDASSPVPGDPQEAQLSAPTANQADPAVAQLTPSASPLRPLLQSLRATVKTDGDRTWIRFTPTDWQTNRAGGLHGAAVCAVADAAVDAVLGRVLPAGSAVQLRSLEMTFLRSIPIEAEVEAVATVVHVGRRLAVIDCEIGPAGARPSALARIIAARTTQR